MNLRHRPFPSSNASPVAALVVLTLLWMARPAGKAAEYAIGADLSFLKQAEAGGTVFRKNFTELLNAGIKGVDAGRGTNARPRIMIHIDKGGNKGATKYFFDKLNAFGVEYDVIGQSYYPWWHGSLEDLRANLTFMANEYRKDIIVVEAAYCWRPTQYRTQPGPFPETPEGQRQFLDEVNRIVLATPNHRGVGIFWWEPSVTGGLRSRSFFDDDGNALPVINVFDTLTKK